MHSPTRAHLYPFDMLGNVIYFSSAIESDSSRLLAMTVVSFSFII